MLRKPTSVLTQEGIDNWSKSISPVIAAEQVHSAAHCIVCGSMDGGRPRSMRSNPAILAARAPSSLPHRARPAQDLDKVLQASGGNSADASAIADAVAAARKEGVDPASPVLRKATALLTALETANVDQGNGDPPAKGRGKREELVPSAETKDETRKREAQLDAIFGGDYDVPELDLGASEGT